MKENVSLKHVLDTAIF